MTEILVCLLVFWSFGVEVLTSDKQLGLIICWKQQEQTFNKKLFDYKTAKCRSLSLCYCRTNSMQIWMRISSLNLMIVIRTSKLQSRESCSSSLISTLFCCGFTVKTLFTCKDVCSLWILQENYRNRSFLKPFFPSHKRVRLAVWRVYIHQFPSDKVFLSAKTKFMCRFCSQLKDSSGIWIEITCTPCAFWTKAHSKNQPYFGFLVMSLIQATNMFYPD